MKRLFRVLVTMYITTFLGEGLIVMYLFNNVRIHGLSIPLSASFALVSYLPSLLLLLVTLRFHSQMSLSLRLCLIGFGRFFACIALVVTGSYLNVLTTILFIAVMEILWYALMPCLDEIEHHCIHKIGVERGETILNTALQAALAVSLFGGGFIFDIFGAATALTIMGVLQLYPPLVFVFSQKNRVFWKNLNKKVNIPNTKNGASLPSAPVVMRKQLFLLILILGVLAAVPQLVNILFPVKIFVLTESSAVAGSIDASYNVGALCVAVFVLFGKSWFGKRWAQTGLLVLLVAGLVVFAFATTVLVLQITYCVLGFAATMGRVQVRAELFRCLVNEKNVAKQWWSLHTNVGLVCCTVGAVLLGLVGFGGQVLFGYLITVLFVLVAIVASIVVENRKKTKT